VTAQPSLAGGVTAPLVGGARTAGLLLTADGLGAVVAVMVVVDALTDAPGSTCSTALVVPAGGTAVSVVVSIAVAVVVTVTVTVVVVSGAVVVGEEVAVVEAAVELLLPELSLPELPLFESSSDPSPLDELESAPTVPVAVAVSVLEAATVASAAVAVADGLDVGVTVAEALVVATDVEPDDVEPDDVEPDDVEPDDVPARTPPVALWVGVPVSIGIAARASAAASNCSSGMQSVAA
jgi:hypothetical protein